MGEIILKNDETFAEYPDGLLLVKEKSNLMYVRICNKIFIAREFFSKISGNDDCIEYRTKYYDIKTNENILTFSFSKTNLESACIKGCKKSDIEIMPLEKILNIKGNHVTYLSIQDIDTIIGFKEEFISGEKHSVI